MLCSIGKGYGNRVPDSALKAVLRGLAAVGSVLKL
jgi:hypothetical protein